MILGAGIIVAVNLVKLHVYTSLFWLMLSHMYAW